jgi:hypothetical protein
MQSNTKVYGKSTIQAFDEGLRRFLINVYNLMAVAVGLTGITAYGLAQNPELVKAMFDSIIPMIFFFVLPFVLLFALNGERARKRSRATNLVLFALFAVSMGILSSATALVYPGVMVAKAFLVSVAVFAGASLYGYTTKADLTSVGSFLVIGLWGLIFASVVNLFLGSTLMEFVISVATVIVFTGLTAYDTQKIKETYCEANGYDLSHYVIIAAMELYLDFLNLFLAILRIFGITSSSSDD